MLPDLTVSDVNDPAERDRILALAARAITQRIADDFRASMARNKKRGTPFTPSRKQIKARRKKGRR